MICGCGGNVFVEAFQGEESGSICVQCGAFFTARRIMKLAEAEIAANLERMKVEAICGASNTRKPSKS